MATATKETLLKLILEKYISLDAPKFFFIRDPAPRELYQRIFDQLATHFVVSDETEPNNDVCLAFCIRGRTSNWSLELSLVGPYAMLTRLEKGIGGTGEPPITAETATDPEAKQIITIVENFGITPLDQDILETPIELKLTNAEPSHTYLYQALITDRPLLPWRTKLNNWWTLPDEIYDKYRDP